MNKAEFMNAVGKQAEETIDDKGCLDYVMIHANYSVRDGLWRFYSSDEGVEKLVKLLSEMYL